MIFFLNLKTLTYLYLFHIFPMCYNINHVFKTATVHVLVLIYGVIYAVYRFGNGHVCCHWQSTQSVVSLWGCVGLTALQRNSHDIIIPRLLLCCCVLITALTSVKAPSYWCESSQVTSSVRLEGLYVTHAEEPDCFYACSGKWSDIWPKARLLTNEPVEDVKHHLETVKSLSATSK